MIRSPHYSGHLSGHEVDPNTEVPMFVS